MKKIIAIVAVIATIASFGQTLVGRTADGRYIYNFLEPAYQSTTEYFAVTIRWQGPVLKDDRTFSHDRSSAKGLLRLRTNNGEQTAVWLYNVGGEIVEERASFQSLVAVDLADGTKKGYFAIDYKVGGRGNGISDASVRLCGELKLKWNESRKHWESMSGDGYAVGLSDGGRVPDLVENASWCAPSKAVLPIRGIVTISPYGYLTGAQQLRMAPKK